jgi:hypothetical protein
VNQNGQTLQSYQWLDVSRGTNGTPMRRPLLPGDLAEGKRHAA